MIAAINGPAAGAGMSLALACDIRICSDSDSTFFACAYGRIGASPDGGMTYFLPRVVGPSRALEILIAGVRPHTLQLTTGEPMLQLQVDVVEYLGMESLRWARWRSARRVVVLVMTMLQS